MPARLAIIADDLTGALDAAAPFAGRGLRTWVAVDAGGVSEGLARDPEVIAVNTASREVPPETARRRVESVLAALPRGLRFLKKVDSRLKGNVEAELAAFGASGLAVLPAIPEFGRVVRDGAIVGFGVDRPIPVRPVLGGLAGRAWAPDTESVADLRAALAEAPGHALLVGARGLAEAMALAMTGRAAAPVRTLGAALTFAIGSRDPITLSQVDALMRARPDLCVIRAPNGIAGAGGAGPAPRLTLLQAVPGVAEAAGGAVSTALAESLGRSALAGRDSLLISGGATAEPVLAALGVRSLEVVGEVLNGLPVSRHGALAIITKSGGFGDRDALVRVAQAVGTREQEPG